MKTLSPEQMILTQSGANKIVNTACGVIGIGSGIYTIGGIAGWWNPVGWVCGALLLADAVCFGLTLA